MKVEVAALSSPSGLCRRKTTCEEAEDDVIVQCCFTSTETMRNIMDREPRMATSTFTQLLSSAHI